MSSKNPYFRKMKNKEKAYREDGSCRVSEIASSGEYTHAYLKYDGTHIDLEIKLPDSIRLLTREGNDVAHLVPYIVQDIRDSVLPRLKQDVVLSCEAVHLNLYGGLYFSPKESWSASRKVLGRKEYDFSLPKINLIVYDQLTNGFYSDRIWNIQVLLGSSKYLKIPFPFSIQELEKCWKEFVEDGGCEGFVLFDNRMTNSEFTKLKPENVDIDCVVLKYHEGKKGTRLEGKLGAFEVGLYKEDGRLVSIGKVPTMTDEERVKWTERMKYSWSIDSAYDDPYVVQVKASEVLPSGKLRFPSYVRERTDKSPKECLWEQLGLN